MYRIVDSSWVRLDKETNLMWMKSDMVDLLALVDRMDLDLDRDMEFLHYLLGTVIQPFWYDRCSDFIARLIDDDVQ